MALRSQAAGLNGAFLLILRNSRWSIWFLIVSSEYFVIHEPDGDLDVQWLSAAKYYDGRGYIDVEFEK